MPNERMPKSFAPSATLATLQERSHLLLKLRKFLYDRDFIEVETPLLAPEIIPEQHIDPIAVPSSSIAGEPRSPGSRGDAEHYLQASPELHMKRLLAAGAERIFQVTRSFRAGERGQLHNPEFTLVEWYRVGDDMQAGIDLLDELMQTLLGTPPAARASYAEAFERALALSPHFATTDEFAAVAAKVNVAVPEGMNRANRDEWLNLFLATRIEPQLGRDRPEIIYHYPATQASLANVISSDAGHRVAERFELYYRGIELANGFHELTDAAEQRCRFQEVNAMREAAGHLSLSLPESLLAAMQHGIPPCTGCALGFDRLVMLAADAQSITAVMAFSSLQGKMQ